MIRSYISPERLYNERYELIRAVIQRRFLSAQPRRAHGGGTFFESPQLSRGYQADRGDCLCSCGQLLHGARDVTGGARYVAVCFNEEEFEGAPRSAAALPCQAALCRRCSRRRRCSRCSRAKQTQTSRDSPRRRRARAARARLSLIHI